MHKDQDHQMHPEILSDLFAGLRFEDIAAAARAAQAHHTSDSSAPAPSLPSATLFSTSPSGASTSRPGRIARVEIDGMEAVPQAHYPCPNCNFILTLVRVQSPDEESFMPHASSSTPTVASRVIAREVPRTPVRQASASSSALASPYRRGKYEWYAVTKGRQIGIYHHWDNTEPLVEGLPSRLWHCKGFDDEMAAYKYFVSRVAEGSTHRVTAADLASSP